MTALFVSARAATRLCDRLLRRGCGAVQAFLAWTCRLSRGTTGRVARIAAGLSFGVAALAGAGLYQTLFLDPFGLPDLDEFLASGPPTIGQIEDANGLVLAELAREYRRPLEQHELPAVLRKALLAAEDKNFYQHRGIDLDAWPRVILKVLVASHGAGRLAFPQGGSTLTQQLVRVAFLSDWWRRENDDVLLVDSLPNRLLASVVGVRAANKARRKLEEIRLALWLEEALARRLASRALAKEEILRRYAMYVYLGDGRYGFAAASEHYLGRELRTLEDEDAHLAAVLAGIVKAPTTYSPVEANRANVLRRRNQILHLMERQGFITGAQRARLEWAPLPARVPSIGVRPEAVAAVDWVLDSLGGLGDPTLTTRSVFDGRIRIRATVDGRLQTIAAEALENGLRAFDRRRAQARGSVQGAVVVLANDDARILALVGGRIASGGAPVRMRDFNRATMARRQAGSTMKPLVYFTALRLGYALDSVVADDPVWLSLGRGRGAKRVANYDGLFKGPVTLRRALAESRNAATVRLAEEVGIREVLRTARELGIRQPLAPYVTTALGASEVTLLELANVYRAFSSGRLAEPWIVRSVLARDGGVLYARPAPRMRPLDDPAVAFIQEALRGTVRLPGGTGRALDDLPFAVMGKTGTTNDYRDALFIGSTYGPAGVTVAVRVGYDDNRSLGDGETGGRTALPVFREIVTRAYPAVLGDPPAFPERLERGIQRYLVASAQSGGSPGEAAPGEAAAQPALSSGDVTLAPAVATPDFEEEGAPGGASGGAPATSGG